MSSESIFQFSSLMQSSRATVRRWREGSRQGAGRWLRKLHTADEPATSAARLTILMADEDEPLRWWFQSSGRREEGEARSLSDIPAAFRAAPAHVWTPARSTRICSVTSPSQDAKNIKKALPFMLEETTLDEPENLHFAYTSAAGGALSVAVTARAALQRWLGRFRDAGLTVVSAAPVSLGLLCEPPQSGSLAFFGQRCCARLSDSLAFSCSFSMETPPPELVASLAQSTAAGITLERLTVQAPPPGLNQSAWESALGVALELRPGVALRPSAPLNLLQGEFAPSAAWKKSFETWRPVMAVLGVWLIGSTLVNAWDVMRLTTERRNVMKAQTQLFQSLFPDATVIIDPALQTERNLEALRAQAGSLRPNDFLLLTASVAPAIASQPGAQIKKIDYDDGALTAVVSVPDFQSLETLKAAIDKAAAAEWLGAEGHGGSVEARFRLREAGR